jgi:hypothetical protein
VKIFNVGYCRFIKVILRIWSEYCYHQGNLLIRSQQLQFFSLKGMTYSSCNLNYIYVGIEVRKLGLFLFLHIKFAQIEDACVKTSGSHGCDYEEYGTVDCNTV